MATRLSFSQRHPFLFGFILLAAAMVLIVGVMAAVRFLFFDGISKKSLISGKSIGVVHIEGVIFDPRPVNEWIEELEEDEDIKGVILRIDSPGGGVSASQEIHRAVKRLSESKPVVASMGSVAASGGYYVACPADAILANPGTITGSIGVRMELTNLMGLMDMLGISNESITSGKFKDAGSPYRELTPEERAYFKNVVTDLFDQFVTDVAEGRELDAEKVKEIADGRVFTGRQAQVEGLVDGMGGMDEAETLLKQLAGLPPDEDIPLIEGPIEEEDFWDAVLSSMAQAQVKNAYQSRGPKWLFLY